MMRSMRVLLSTIGSRGDVQPIVALASQVKTLGHDVRLCVPPDFTEWIAGLGLPVIPIGPPVRAFAAARPHGPATPPSLESARAMVDESIATQFTTLTAAVQDCDAIVAATALQVAARSVAETLGIRYVYAGYSTYALQPRESERFDILFAPAVNAHRAAMGLAPVDDIRRHMFTEKPWLAADATLGPWTDSAEWPVFQTGVWLLPDDRPLPPDVEAFLDAGEPPVYFGFGSSRAPENLGRAALDAARRLGRRAIVSRGWFDGALVDDARDCLEIGESNLRALFSRVAAVIHHGGSGTTHLAALGGAPQVVVPQGYDQTYWAQRVQELGIGAAHTGSAPTADELTAALEHALQRDMAARARSMAAFVRQDGALVAATELTENL
jgi:vancomycin aglycone glucosyltransferase